MSASGRPILTGDRQLLAELGPIVTVCTGATRLLRVAQPYRSDLLHSRLSPRESNPTCSVTVSLPSRVSRAAHVHISPSEPLAAQRCAPRRRARRWLPKGQAARRAACARGGLVRPKES